VKKKILIVNYTQFGYHIDSYMYTRYADRDRIEIHYFCFESGFERIYTEDVIVNYIPLYAKRFKSYMIFFLTLKRYLHSEKFDLVFHIEAKFTLFIRLMNLFTPMVLDIRTGDLSDNNFKRFIKNSTIRISSWFYRKVSVITESLRKELKIKEKKVTIIPLGGELHHFDNKEFSSLRLLYTGTLEKRNIDQTIEGLALFKSRNPGTDISYDIVGFGKTATEKKIASVINSTGLEDFVTFHGRKQHNEILPYLDRCNLGLVYIPQTQYYQFQSSTKFYEYVLAGMPVIVTNTYENRAALKAGSGYICNDNAESFAEVLEKLVIDKGKFDSEKIRSMYQSNQWKSIVKEKWEPFVLSNCR